MCYLSSMQGIGVRELRQNASRYLHRVKAGETVEVTERGKIVALLVPPSRGHSTRHRLIAEGLLIPGSRQHPRLARLPRRVPVAKGEPSSDEILDELREERLP
jgi:prevent-host-death family protein